MGILLSVCRVLLTNIDVWGVVFGVDIIVGTVCVKGMSDLGSTVFNSLAGDGLVISKPCPLMVVLLLNRDEPRREKTGFLHMRKQRRRSASR